MYLLQNETGPRVGWRGGKRGKEDEKRIEMYYDHASTTHDECSQYVLQICTHKH